MVVEVCPHCNTLYTRDKFNTDFLHTCNSGDNTLDQEDVLVIGDWQDYTVSSQQKVQDSIIKTAGLQNAALGTEGFVRSKGKVQDFDRTDRGKKKALYRQRQHLEYIDKSKK